MSKEAQIKTLLERGVENIYPSRGAVEKALQSGKKLRIYYGIDPTGDSLHLGHLIQLRKLRQFQQMGHEIIILIGDFTAQIGDPTDKAATRKPLTHKQVLENAKAYKKQIGGVLNLKSAKVRFLYNEKWTNKLKPVDLLELASHFTVGQLIEREMFQKRIREDKSIALHEFLYPIFQAYDSVTMDVDMEIGGNDQMFNMLAGRTLMKKMKNKEKYVLTTKLLEDAEGKKMGKTEGNIVSFKDSADEIFGKVMSWPDKMMLSGYELLTDIDLAQAKKDIQKNPRDAKFLLAGKLVGAIYGDKEAKKAGERFNAIFREKKTDVKMPEVKVKSGKMNIVELVFATGQVSSKSDARRLVQQGGVSIDERKATDVTATIDVVAGIIIKIGKHRMVKVKK